MQVSNRTYMEVEVREAKTPTEYEPVIRCKDGVVWVTAKWKDGSEFWVRADRLKREQEAVESALEHLINQVWSLGINRLGLSKAEMKRRLIRTGVISK